VTAVFGPLHVNVRVRVVGGGRVLGDAPCSASCSKKVDGGSALFLNAKPKQGCRFVGWTGACRGRGQCEPSTDADLAVTARFVKVEARPKAKR
jgi:hypothetical protein